MEENLTKDKKYTAADIMRISEEFERESAIQKADYWINCGCAWLAEDQELSEKWRTFVEKNVYVYGTGELLDETLQIMSMIKAGFKIELIKTTLEQIPAKDTVIHYLSGFIPADTLYSIQNSDKRVL